MSEQTLLLDGDIIAYQCASAAEQPIKWDDDCWTLHAFESDVEQRIDSFIDNLKQQTGISKVASAISHTKNFRKEVAPYYKENRKDIRRPMLLKHAKSYLMSEYTGIVLPNLEADDVLGMYASQGLDYVIWSTDKDLLTVPGLMVIDGEVKENSIENADYNFYKQTLTGDMVDNYPGCPKIGPKTAEKVLKDQDDMWGAVVQAYQNAGLSEAVALENARLARILRTNEYDFDKQQPILWQPN